MAEKLSRLKAIRGGHRGVVTKYEKEATMITVERDFGERGCFTYLNYSMFVGGKTEDIKYDRSGGFDTL